MGDVCKMYVCPLWLQADAHGRSACMHVQLILLCSTLCTSMDWSLPGSPVHGVLQARILEWVAMPSSKGSSWPRNQVLVSSISCTAGGLFTAEPPKKPSWNVYRNAIYGHHTLLRKAAAISRLSPNLTEFSFIDQLKSSTMEKGILEYMLPRCNRQWWWKTVSRLTSIVCSFVNLGSKTTFWTILNLQMKSITLNKQYHPGSTKGRPCRESQNPNKRASGLTKTQFN